MHQEYSIMLVDDDDALRESISDLLLISGYRVFPAASGEEGLDILAGTTLHLIISDIMLPGIDGLVLHDSIAQHPEWSLIPFIFMSAKAELRELLRSRGLENETFLTKPFDTDNFLSVVESLLQ
jgi:CheY-like chemotaxis protein